jgi:hypothetical protein
MSWRAQNRSKDAKTPSAGRGMSEKPELDLWPIQPAILEHHVKCNTTPQHTRDWAAQQISDRDARRKGKDSVKKMESAFNDIEEDDTQRKIGSCICMCMCMLEH